MFYNVNDNKCKKKRNFAPDILSLIMRYGYEDADIILIETQSHIVVRK